MEVYAECPFCNSKAELKLQTVPSSTQQYKCTKCGAWFTKARYGVRRGGTYSIGTGGIDDGCGQSKDLYR